MSLATLETVSPASIDLSKIRRELDAPYALSPLQIKAFQKDGCIKLKEVLSPELIAYYGEEITRQVLLLNTNTKPMEERSTYQKAFLQVMNLWTKSDVVREFVFSKRLARIAAELMGVKGVRLYHDQALYKESRGGHTPWHADQFYWPLSNGNSITLWAPLQATPIEMGPLAFSAGSHTFDYGRGLAISDESEEVLQKVLTEKGFPYLEGPFDLGEVSFHYGWTYHRAGANKSGKVRSVMTIIYIEDGIRVIEPLHDNHRSDLKNWMPGVKVGDIAASPLNPVLY